MQKIYYMALIAFKYEYNKNNRFLLKDMLNYYIDFKMVVLKKAVDF